MPTEIELQQRFEACIDDCADSLFRVAYRMTGDESLARELVQETYLNAWKNLGSLSDIKKIRGWMFAILRNQFTKQIRAESRKVPTSDQIERMTAAPATINESHEMIHEGLAQLEEKYKLPLLLVAMEQISVEEAAEILDMPRGTVLSRLHRGRQKLKGYLVRDNERVDFMNQKSKTDGI